MWGAQGHVAPQDWRRRVADLSSLEDHASSLEGATRAMDASYTAADVL